MIYVLAGDSKQAKDYINFKRYKPTEVRIIDRPADIRGLFRITITTVGTWYLRHDIRNIEEDALSRMHRFVEDTSW